MFFLFSLSIIIAQRGQKTEYTIVLPSDKGKSYYSYSASQLIEGIHKIVGDDVQLTSSNGKVYSSYNDLPKKAIYLYESNYSRYFFSNKLHDLTEDSFEVKVKGDNLFICGGSRGVIYGVYDILEKFGGVRFYASWMKVYPSSQKFEIPDKTSYSEKAVFAFREHLFTPVAWDPDMASKLRANGGDAYITDKHGGRLYVSYNTYVGLLNSKVYPMSKYPEYYALYNGARTSSHVCLSNENVFKIIRDNFINVVKKSPNCYFHNIDQADGWDHCLCDKCKEKANKYETYAGVQMEFLNKIAEAVEEAGYNIRLRTYAYVYTLTPPKNIKPHKFLHFRLAPISADYSHSMETATYYGMPPFYKQINGWSALTRNINIYDYTPCYSHPNLIFPNLHVLGPNIRFYANYKSIGYLCDDYYGGYNDNNVAKPWYHQYMSEYKAYLISKLLWNPYINETYITREFLRGYYGPHAAPYIDQFLSEMGQKALNEISFLNCLGYIDSFFPKSYINHIKWLWDKALEGAKTDSSIDSRYEYNVRKSRISILTNEYRLFKGNTIQLDFTEKGATPKTTKEQKAIINELLEQCSLEEDDQERITQCYPISGFNKNAFLNAATSYKSELIKWINYDSGVSITSSSSSSFKGIVFPNHSGRLGYLAYNGYNYIDGTNGGIDALSPTDPHQNFIRNIQVTDTLVENTTSSAKVEYKWTDSRYYSLIKTFSLSGTNTLKYETQFINQKDSTNTLHPVWYFNFNLGTAEYVSWKWSDESNWNARAIRDDTEYEFYGSAHSVTGAITIVDPVSKRGVSIQMPSQGGLTHLLIQCNKSSSRTSVYIYIDQTTLQSKATLKHEFIITPLSGQTATKATKEAVPTGSLERINIYDVQIPYNSANEGIKNSYMTVDSSSSTGRAMANPPSYHISQILLYLSTLRSFGIQENVQYNVSWYATCDLNTSVKANTIFYGRAIGSDGQYTMLSQSTWEGKSGTYIQLPCKGNPITVNDNAKYFWRTYNGCKTSRIERLEFIRLSPTPTPTPEPTSTFTEDVLDPWLDPIDPSDYTNPSPADLTEPISSDSKSGLSSGAVAGIVIVVIILLAAGGFALFIYNRRRQHTPAKEDTVSV